jgi:meiotically up-regulated gene 157 (Mug157) protein
VFECKYELDSLAAFLEVSTNYYNATQDLDFFGKYQWVPAIQAVMNTAIAMMTPTYGADGQVLDSPYTFTRLTTRATETLANDGLGSPVANGTGLIRSAFRPSDDSTLFQLFIPANMMFSRYLASAAEIMAALGDTAPPGLAQDMTDLSSSVRAAIQSYGVVTDPISGTSVYAYEVDGFGSAAIMDDANIPSLLSAPFLGFLDAGDEIYQNTRAAVLDQSGTSGNPYFMRGPVINAIGGPHLGPGMAWPMASIVRILTSDDEAEIIDALGDIVSSTDRFGLIHESVNTFNQSVWTRQW